MPTLSGDELRRWAAERNAVERRAEVAERDLARARQLGEWIERDRRESDKVLTYAMELQRLGSHSTTEVPE